MTKVLVAYATRAGSTREVANRVADRVDAAGICVDVRPADAVTDLDSYDGVVLGSALYTGRLHPAARRFLRRHRTRLAELPFAIFAMGPRTLDDDDVAGARTQLEAGLRKVPELHPMLDGIFGGVVDPARLRFPLNRLPASDARDWTAIEEWADLAAALLRTDLPAFGARNGVDTPHADAGVDRHAAVG